MDLAFVVFLAANMACALAGAFFRPGDWYEGLRKPSWRPPNFAFPIVWGALFIMSTVSVWLVWHAASPELLWVALPVYALQLVLNAGWSALFFGARNMRLALVELGALWLSIAALIVLFSSASTVATLLLLPYLGWVSIAGYLNWTMIQMNPREAGPPLGAAGL